MYTPEFKEQAISKALQRGNKPLQTIADELNIVDWSRAARFQALMQSASLQGEALNSFCREQGIFSHHLQAWKAEFITESTQSETAIKSSNKALRDEVAQLKKELNRKEKALAEAAALLVLQKKFQAFYEEKA
jgi:transposase-like protein